MCGSPYYRVKNQSRIGAFYDHEINLYIYFFQGLDTDGIGCFKFFQGLEKMTAIFPTISLRQGYDLTRWKSPASPAVSAVALAKAGTQSVPRVGKLRKGCRG
jgi:hypothetical protein